MGREADIQKIETGDSVKVAQVLDDATKKAVEAAGYQINYTLENYKLVLMFVACLFALLAQFYPMPFPDSRPLLGLCCVLYFVLSMILQYVVIFVEKDTVVTTYPKEDAKDIRFFRLDATFERFQENYVVTVYNGDDLTQFTKGQFYVGRYFTEKGEFDQKGFTADILKHIQRFHQKKFTEFTYTHKSD